MAMAFIVKFLILPGQEWRSRRSINGAFQLLREAFLHIVTFEHNKIVCMPNSDYDFLRSLIAVFEQGPLCQLTIKLHW